MTHRQTDRHSQRLTEKVLKMLMHLKHKYLKFIGWMGDLLALMALKVIFESFGQISFFQ